MILIIKGSYSNQQILRSLTYKEPYSFLLGNIAKRYAFGVGGFYILQRSTWISDYEGLQDYGTGKKIIMKKSKRRRFP